MISFQSRFGNEPLFKPYTDETLEKLGEEKIKHLSIITRGFSSDNIETLEEFNIEGRKRFFCSGCFTSTLNFLFIFSNFIS